MAVKFFGQFLVEQGIVTGEAVRNAISLQDKTNLKLGEIAVAMGLLTPADVQRAHNQQMSKDQRLGDVLVESGMLSPDQLEDVLVRQRNIHLYIGEALLQVGALTKESLQTHLDAFKADQTRYNSDRIALPATLPDEKIWEMTVDLTHKMVTRVLGLQFHPGEPRVAPVISSNFMMAAMDMSGDVQGRYLISVSRELQQSIAKAILNEESVEGEPVEVLEDTVMEFVNIVCGNVAAKASQMGVVMDIAPPESIHPPTDGLTVSDGWTALCFPIHLDDGETMELYLIIKS